MLADPEKACSGFAPASNLCFSSSPMIKWLKLISINLLAFGLELCASAAFSYIPPVMLKKGFSDSSLTFVMGIGPFISFILVPIVGRWSDKCNSRFGRRRPFILVLGILTLLSLLVVPYSAELSLFLYGIVGESVILSIGVIGLDFSTQALMNPCKALIPDLFKSTEEQNSGFTVYSFMLSMGGCVGYLISSINWVDTALGVAFGGQEKVVFCVLAICFLFLLLINLSLAKEIPLEEIRSNNILNNINDSSEDILIERTNNAFPLNNDSVSMSKFSLSHPDYCNTELRKNCKSFLDCFKLRIICCNFKTIAKYFFICITVPFKGISTVKSSILYFFDMPVVLVHLFVSTLFGWMGIMCHDLFYTDFVGQVIYRGKPKAENESLSLNLYNQGVRMGSWGLLLHCLSAAIYSGFIHEKFVVRYGLRTAYLSGIMIFTLSLIGTVQTNNLILVNLFSALSGTGYSALSTVPYTLVTLYHNSKEKRQVKEDRGIGEDLAVLDSAFSLSQIIPSLFLGFIVDLTGSPVTYMVIAAICGAAASYSAFFIQFPLNRDTSV